MLVERSLKTLRVRPFFSRLKHQRPPIRFCSQNQPGSKLAEKINEDPTQMHDFLRTLNHDSKALLQTEISSSERFQSSDPPTQHQLVLTGFHAAIPFVGFGFLDNLLMIVWGDAIDHYFGCTFGISIMAAAAVGNTLSDCGGVLCAEYVEALAAKLKIQRAGLSRRQKNFYSTRCASLLGASLGVTVGCILGMFPLLFMDTDVTSFRRLFATADTDADGKITKTELQCFFSSIGLNISNSQVEDFIDKYDRDSDGCLDFEECLNCMDSYKVQRLAINLA